MGLVVEEVRQGLPHRMLALHTLGVAVMHLEPRQRLGHLRQPQADGIVELPALGTQLRPVIKHRRVERVARRQVQHILILKGIVAGDPDHPFRGVFDESDLAGVPGYVPARPTP